MPRKGHPGLKITRYLGNVGVEMEMIDRTSVMRRNITKEQLGIEFGPMHCPLVPKREGFRVLTLDVYDVPTLRQRAKDLPGCRMISFPISRTSI
jgi:hypothetical protein